jgi:cysteinyl-tRNA synthetase
VRLYWRRCVQPSAPLCRNEREFLEDMAALGVEPADELPRVSEHIPEVITFVQDIVKKGYAYEADGSVYFDTTAFSADHPYGKLKPESVGNEDAALEGEGALGKSVGASSKRNSCDFALWKAAKEGEPSWESPWGAGRPGWHIECSVMATHALKAHGTGGVMDIHSGGVDLQFPHHDNELAQSEACLGCKQWVQYFLHSGHLNIKGMKMSKSLKNFTTIRQALTRYPARHLRMLFLSHRYHATLNYSPEMMDEVAAKDQALIGFLDNSRQALRVLSGHAPTKLLAGGAALANAVKALENSVAKAFADDFDTPTVLSEMLSLVALANAYMAKPSSIAEAASSDAAEESLNGPVLRYAASTITRFMRLMGLIDSGLASAIGSVSASASGGEDASGVIDALAEFRQMVRAAAKSKDFRAIMEACDWVRDEKMARMGVKLEDAEGVSASESWKRTDPADLIAEIERRKAAAVEAAERAEALRLAREAEEEAAARILAIPPEDYFKLAPEFAGKFSEFDSTGMPVKDSEGADLSKGATKKLAKALEKHSSKREKWLAKQEAASAASSSS